MIDVAKGMALSIVIQLHHYSALVVGKPFVLRWFVGASEPLFVKVSDRAYWMARRKPYHFRAC